MRDASRLFAGTLLLIALFTKTTPHSAHEFSRLGTVESLVERGTFRLDDSTFVDTLDKIRRDGHYYSHQPPLLAIIEAPVYALLRVTGMRFNNSGRLVMAYLFSVLTNGVAFALTVVIFERILALAGVSRRRRIVHAILWPAGTWLLPYALVANNHGIAGLLLALGAWLLLRTEQDGVTAWRAAALGLVMGSLAAIEILPLISFVPLAILFLARRSGMTPRMWVAFVSSMALPLGVHAAANVAITGDVLPAGLHHELFQYPGTAFDSHELSGTLKYTSFSTAAAYAWQSLFAGKGYFTFAPLLILALVAALHRRDWMMAPNALGTLLGGALISLVVSLLTTNNFGGEAVGFRHATYLAPAWLVFLPPWLSDAASPARRRIVTGVAIVSACSMLVFAAARPWSVLTISSPSIGTLSDYVPVVMQLIEGRLLTP